jgi:hypothetical protein
MISGAVQAAWARTIARTISLPNLQYISTGALY